MALVKQQFSALYAPQPQICPDMSRKPIEFANCFPAFFTFICGAILSLLLFGLEFIMKPFDQIFDGLGNSVGDYLGDGKDSYVEIRAMGRDHLE